MYPGFVKYHFVLVVYLIVVPDWLLVYLIHYFLYSSVLPMPVRHLSRMHLLGEFSPENILCNIFPLKIVSPHGGKWTNANIT